MSVLLQLRHSILGKTKTRAMIFEEHLCSRDLDNLLEVENVEGIAERGFMFFLFLTVGHETVGIYTLKSLNSLCAVFKLVSALFIKGIWLTFIL